MQTPASTPPVANDTRALTRGLLLVILASLVLYAALAAAADGGRVAAALARFPLEVLAAAMGLSFLNYGVRYVRWRLYCARLAIALEPRTSFLIHLSGLALTVSPGKMGEAFKSVLVRRITGTPIAASVTIVVAERFTDLLGFLILIALGESSGESGQGWIVGCTIALCAGLLVFVGSRRLQELLLKFLGRTRRGARAVPAARAALESSRVLLAPRALLVPTLLAAAGWSLECLGFQLVASAFVEGGVPFLFATSTYALAAVAGAVAFVFPGGLGVTEASMGALLKRRYAACGLPPEAASACAVSATILIRLATLWFAVGVGIVAALLFRRRHGGFS